MTVIDVYSVYVKPLLCKLLTLCALFFAWSEQISLETGRPAATSGSVADSDFRFLMTDGAVVGPCASVPFLVHFCDHFH